MTLLDTNVLSEPLRNKPHPKVYRRFNVQAGNFAASVVTLNELRFGAMLREHPLQMWSKIETILVPLVHWIEVDSAIALKAADLQAHLRRTGQTVDINDCYIAATALVNDWILVTRNTAHFKRMPGLQLENWFQ
jgi:tRNA(fMet)-specific endonuclease VapC